MAMKRRRAQAQAAIRQDGPSSVSGVLAEAGHWLHHLEKGCRGLKARIQQQLAGPGQGPMHVKYRSPYLDLSSTGQILNAGLLIMPD